MFQKQLKQGGPDNWYLVLLLIRKRQNILRGHSCAILSKDDIQKHFDEIRLRCMLTSKAQSGHNFNEIIMAVRFKHLRIPTHKNTHSSIHQDLCCGIFQACMLGPFLAHVAFFFSEPCWLTPTSSTPFSHLCATFSSVLAPVGELGLSGSPGPQASARNNHI
jgi:hypothetical protein